MKLRALASNSRSNNITIAVVAQRMREIAELIQNAHPKEAGELLELADGFRRRPIEARAQVTSNPLTPDLAQDIREYAAENPGLSHQAIAEEFNVNHGRASEALKGKRG